MEANSGFLSVNGYKWSFTYIFSSAGNNNFCLVHVSLVPVLGVVGEQVRRNFALFSYCNLLLALFLPTFHCEHSCLLLNGELCIECSRFDVSYRKPNQHSTVFGNFGLWVLLLICWLAEALT